MKKSFTEAELVHEIRAKVGWQGDQSYKYGPNEVVQLVRTWGVTMEQQGVERERMRLRTSREQIDNNFVYHQPLEGQPERYTELRESARKLAHLIVDQTPASREQSLALTNLEQAIFWANAAIARNEAG